MTMRRTVGLEDVRNWAGIAAEAADEKQGSEITVLEVGAILAITDMFVITSAPNDRHVRTIAEEIERKVKEAGGPAPLAIEGLDDARWVLMDYGDFVVHVFLDESRRYYDLERLWLDAPRFDWKRDRSRATASGE